MRASLRWLFLLAALAPHGACNAGSSCLRTTDCSTGYVCAQGQCELARAPDAGPDASDDAGPNANDAAAPDGASGQAGSSSQDAGLDAHAGGGGEAGQAGAI